MAAPLPNCTYLVLCTNPVANYYDFLHYILIITLWNGEILIYIPSKPKRQMKEGEGGNDVRGGWVYMWWHAIVFFFGSQESN